MNEIEYVVIMLRKVICQHLINSKQGKMRTKLQNKELKWEEEATIEMARITNKTAKSFQAGAAQL